MGQTNGTPTSDNVLEETVSSIHYELKKHAQCLMEINSLTYDDFNKCLVKLNDMSRNCVDSNGKLTVFAVKKGSDDTFLWKATIRIACVKCDPETNKIESYKLINLQQFLKVFNTFQSHLEAMSTCEEQHDRRRLSTLLSDVPQLSPDRETTSNDEPTECCICLDRKPDTILPCAHVFCTACIEQWNSTHKNCPICQEKVDATDDSWVMSELPQANEVNEKIITELTEITKRASDDGSDDSDSD